jgi:hypothetical protein
MAFNEIGAARKLLGSMPKALLRYRRNLHEESLCKAKEFVI